MPKYKQETIRLVNINGYIYYQASCTIMQKQYKKYFKPTDEGFILAEEWLKNKLNSI